MDQEPSKSKSSKDGDFHCSFEESILFDKTIYKYVILGCKNKTSEIMNKGVISACDRDKITLSLERIQDDIERGKFRWIDGADVHMNIVEALADKLGDLPKDLAVDSKHDSCLLILETWCKQYIDQIVTQIKQLQAALVLLTIRNDGLVLPGNTELEGNRSIESLVLPILKALDGDGSYHLFIRVLIYYDAAFFFGNRYSDDDSYFKRFALAVFFKSINRSIPEHLIQLLEKFAPWKNHLSGTPYDESAACVTILRKLSPDEEQKRDQAYFALSKYLQLIAGVDGSPQDYEIEDAKDHLFSSAEVVQEMLKLTTQFVEEISFDYDKLQSLKRGYGDLIGFVQFLTSKGIALKTAYAMVQLCLEKQVQPSELTLDELRGIDFPCERAHGLLQDKGSVFGDFTCRDMSKVLKWCSKLKIGPEPFTPEPNVDLMQLFSKLRSS